MCRVASTSKILGMLYSIYCTRHTNMYGCACMSVCACAHVQNQPFQSNEFNRMKTRMSINWMGKKWVNSNRKHRNVNKTKMYCVYDVTREYIVRRYSQWSCTCGQNLVNLIQRHAMPCHTETTQAPHLTSQPYHSTHSREIFVRIFTFFSLSISLVILTTSFWLVHSRVNKALSCAGCFCAAHAMERQIGYKIKIDGIAVKFL